MFCVDVIRFTSIRAYVVWVEVLNFLRRGCVHGLEGIYFFIYLFTKEFTFIIQQVNRGFIRNKIYVTHESEWLSLLTLNLMFLN